MLFGVLFLIACQNGSDKKETTKKKVQEQTVQTAKVNKELHPKLAQALPNSSVIEFAFFMNGMELSSETTGQQPIRAFYNHIDSVEVVKKPNCRYDNYEGSTVFRSREGDITLTIDFVVTDPNCRFAKVTIDNKTYYQQITESGVRYLMQFMQLRTKPGGAK